MPRYPRVFGLAAWAVVACAQAPETESSSSGPRATVQALGAGARVSVLSTRPGSGTTRWLEHTLGARAPVELARLAHLPGGSVRGALVPGRQAVVAIGDADARGDGSFGGALWLLEPGSAPRLLAEGCVHASRPLPVSGSSVLVERGEAGSGPIPAGQLRTDQLEITKVDLASGAQSTLHAFSGYATHLAGMLGDEAFVYRVSHGHADVVALGLASGAVRVLVGELPAFARDFSVDADAGALVFTNRDDAGWVVERLDVESGVRTTLARVGGMWATPRVWPSGGVLLNDGRGGKVLGGSGLDRPLGAGFDVLEQISADGRWAALSHQSPGAPPSVYLVDIDTGALSVLPLERGERAEIVGVSP